MYFIFPFSMDSFGFLQDSITLQFINHQIHSRVFKNHFFSSEKNPMCTFQTIHNIAFLHKLHSDLPSLPLPFPSFPLNFCTTQHAQTQTFFISFLPPKRWRHHLGSLIANAQCFFGKPFYNIQYFTAQPMNASKCQEGSLSELIIVQYITGIDWFL